MSIAPILSHLKTHFSKKSINVIEIGARYGESSKVIVKNLHVDKYIIIDPYTSYNEYSSDGFNKIMSNDTDDIIFNKTKNELESLHNNMVFYRTFSTDTNTINAIEDTSIDLIFIL